jgi:hypothetical protein
MGANRDSHPREFEAALLARCVAAARTRDEARDQMEANVFRLAAMVLQSKFPRESASLMQSSNRYFTSHPADKLAPETVCRRWLFGLSRLRSTLSHRLRYGY